MEDLLRIALSQMQAIHAHNPSLRDASEYQHEYEQSVATLSHVIDVGVLENLLADLQP